MNIEIIANWITGFCEAYFLFILFDTFMKWKDDIPRSIKTIGIVCVGILIDISNNFFTTGLINIILVIIIQYVASYLYNGAQKTKILTAILTFMLAAVTEVIVLILLSFVFNKDVYTIINEANYRICGIIISKVLGYVFVKCISFKFRKGIKTFDTNYWILFAIMFGFAIFMMYTFCAMLEEGASDHVRNMAMLCSFGVGLATVIILFLYEGSIRQKNLLTEKQLAEVHMKEQMKHYDDIMMSQGEIKKVKHDLQNHLLSIRAQLNRQEYNGCVQYINGLLEHVDTGGNYIDTGNTVLDAIISTKKAEAERYRIKFNLDVRIPQNLPLSKEDECVIFGNALDNAIEACRKLDTNRYINISLIFDKDSLMCKIVNSCVLDDLNNYRTTKEDYRNHGIGSKSIQNALNKHDSICKINRTGSEYELFFIIMGLSTK